ncbi:MAG: ABC transporter substrate-binding protein [Promethearchaeota archaeon]
MLSLLMTVPLGLVVVTPVFTQSPPHFTITLIASLNNPFRVQVAQVIANELPKIGIDTDLVLLGWDDLVVHLTGSLSHADYAGDGFDIGLIGLYADSNDLSAGNMYWERLGTSFHSSSVDPASLGFNWYPVENETLDGILENSANTSNFEKRKEYTHQALDMIVWDIHPMTGLYQEVDPFYIRDNVQGFDAYRFPIEEIYFADDQSTGHGQVNELIVASSRRPFDYNPVFSWLQVSHPPLDLMRILTHNWWRIHNSYLTVSPAFCGLLGLNSSLHYVPGLLRQLPYPVAVENNYTHVLSSLDPDLATVWELELREDIYWHEGYGYRMDNATHREILKLDADDLVWYFKALLNDTGPPLDQSDRFNFQLVFGTDPEKAIIKKDQYRVQFHLTKSEAERRGKPSMFALFLCSILPQHILDPTYNALGLGTGVRADHTSAPSYQDWETDDYNLGYRTAGDITHAATIGNGAYVLYPGENEAQQTVTLTSFNHYFKDNDTSYWQALVEKRPDKYIYKWIPKKETALRELEQGEIDLMDIQYLGTSEYPVMRNKTGINVVKQLSSGLQEMSYNIMNGAGGKLADVNVRLAISHMIPRQDIVNYLSDGLNEPNFMPYLKQSPYYPDDIEPITYNITKAIEYMEKAGYEMGPYMSTSTPGFEILSIFVTLGAMTAAVLIYRHRKREKRFSLPPQKKNDL